MIKSESDIGQISQLNKVRRYYTRAGEYQPGRLLDGVCHFGYTFNDCNDYDLKTAQHNMDQLLGQTLNLPKGSTVLDAGCGYGPVARTLTTDFGLNVVGIDLMEDRLHKALQLNDERGVSKIGLAGADYHKLPFSDNSFDGVYTMETLVHASPLETVLKEFKRVLKPGGTLVLFEYSIPDLDALNPLVRTMANKVIRRTAMASLPRFIHGEFPNLLEDAGFEVINVADISKNVWSTWRFLWMDALKRMGNQIIGGTFSLNTIQGSTMIYPARHHLGYVTCKAKKPENLSIEDPIL